jgi:hypothetical protein
MCSPKRFPIIPHFFPYMFCPKFKFYKTMKVGQRGVGPYFYFEECPMFLPKKKSDRPIKVAEITTNK